MMANGIQRRKQDGGNLQDGLRQGTVASRKTEPLSIPKDKLISKLNDSEMRELIEKAVELTYQNEKFLFEHNLAEWSIAFQFAYYLRTLCQCHLGEYSFDAEYNHSKVKRELWKKFTSDGGWVRPDIIIHKRRDISSVNDKSDNVLWVELKKHGGKQLLLDCNKLILVTQDASEVGKGVEAVSGYKFGLSLLMQKTKVEYRWFSKGQMREPIIKDTKEFWRSK